ncbi:hypothetical protein SAMN05444484_101455 [Flavobacterium chilense]|uniref:Uncharacterized protein n=1 Tax=Flavobacterium chilense TaxID=946677 RepID=A0A1M6Y7J4_9FLAO|nr:hypothetical protein SAMN05444484_101455 [Flavobacterium chilense]
MVISIAKFNGNDNIKYQWQSQNSMAMAKFNGNDNIKSQY